MVGFRKDSYTIISYFALLRHKKHWMTFDVTYNMTSVLHTFLLKVFYGILNVLPSNHRIEQILFLYFYSPLVKVLI